MGPDASDGVEEEVGELMTMGPSTELDPEGATAAAGAAVEAAEDGEGAEVIRIGPSALGPAEALEALDGATTDEVGAVENEDGAAEDVDATAEEGELIEMRPTPDAEVLEVADAGGAGADEAVGARVVEAVASEPCAEADA
jgi:hypothetical protein